MPTTLFPIVPKYNLDPESSSAPTNADLQLGEVGVNTLTGKLFVKGKDGVYEVASDRVANTRLTAAATPGGVPYLDLDGHINLVQIAGLTTTQIADVTTEAIANKIPKLDANGKISTAQLPSSVQGALSYKGKWDFNTSPVLAEDGHYTIGTETFMAAKGDYWVVGTSSTGFLTPEDVFPLNEFAGNTQYLTGDHMIWNGTSWDLVHGAKSEVISVNHQTPIDGNVTLGPLNIGAFPYTFVVSEATPNMAPKLNANGQIGDVQLQKATSELFGIVKVGTGLTINSETGKLNVLPGTDTILPATATQLGGIKVGTTLSVDSTGILNVATAGTY